MARVYSRRKGKSGSTRPVKKVQPTWLRYSAAEVEMLVSKLAKEGQTASEIGVHLRDTYGIPDVKMLTKKPITKIMEEKHLTKKIPQDLMDLIQKTVLLNKHLEKNKHDQTAKRGLIINNAKIGRLSSYYINKGKLPGDWKFEPQKARMYVE